MPADSNPDPQDIFKYHSSSTQARKGCGVLLLLINITAGFVFILSYQP